MDIRCRKTSCEFNDNHTCMAKEITVSKVMECNSYKNSAKKQVDTSATMFEKPPKNSPHRDRKTMKIGCKAPCLFNDKGCCRANGITVNDLGEPYCVTYAPK